MLAIQVGLPFRDSFLLPVRDGTTGLREWFLRHYSARRYRDRKPRKIVGPGEYEILVSDDLGSLVVFRRSFRKISEYYGIYLTVFRREPHCRYRASEILLEAERLARERWPGLPFFTFVNPKKVRSKIPGYCFLRAGWKRIGMTPGGLLDFKILKPAGDRIFFPVANPCFSRT